MGLRCLESERTSMAPVVAFDLRDLIIVSFAQDTFAAGRTEGMLPAPKACALPGRRTKTRQRTRSQEPFPKLGRAMVRGVAVGAGEVR